MGARVLIIEDNPANLEVMRYLVAAFGHTVVTAENGRSGLEAVAAEALDLVLCDVQLPDIDGFEIARRLREMPAFDSLPLVAVTALAMMGDRDRVLAAGFDGYLAKPIDPEIFIQQMEVYLPLRFHSACQGLPAALGIPHATAVDQHFTILVVDNLAINLDLARSILGPSGYRVRTATGVSEGLASARESPCDLILSDVCMAAESGFDFLTEARADPQLRDIPFILITSTMMDEKDQRHGLKLGADRYLRRPIEPEMLLGEIRACLRQKVRR